MVQEKGFKVVVIDLNSFLQKNNNVEDGTRIWQLI